MTPLRVVRAADVDAVATVVVAEPAAGLLDEQLVRRVVPDLAG